ncbi:MAG: hypothetical protein R2788_03595 [Saprospiraceae bacterium]
MKLTRSVNGMDGQVVNSSSNNEGCQQHNNQGILTINEAVSVIVNAIGADLRLIVHSHCCWQQYRNIRPHS